LEQNDCRRIGTLVLNLEPRNYSSLSHIADVGVVTPWFRAVCIGVEDTLGPTEADTKRFIVHPEVHEGLKPHTGIPATGPRWNQSRNSPPGPPELSPGELRPGGHLMTFRTWNLSTVERDAANNTRTSVLLNRNPDAARLARDPLPSAAGA